MSAHGHFHTHHEHTAEHLRFACFDYLLRPVLSINDLGWTIGKGGDSWASYRIEFRDMPLELYDKLAALYVGEDAVYPYYSGVCAFVNRE